MIGSEEREHSSERWLHKAGKCELQIPAGTVCLSEELCEKPWKSPRNVRQMGIPTENCWAGTARKADPWALVRQRAPVFSYKQMSSLNLDIPAQLIEMAINY